MRRGTAGCSTKGSGRPPTTKTGYKEMPAYGKYMTFDDGKSPGYRNQKRDSPGFKLSLGG